jgi:hypothetical protein
MAWRLRARAAPLASPAQPAIPATKTPRRACHPALMTTMPRVTDRRWSREFDEPIPMLLGNQLVTLEDVGTYITKLPEAEHTAPEWQAAMECLILVAEKNGPTMMARIGVMRALNRNVERVFNPDRKETHWGKSKLTRDE